MNRMSWPRRWRLERVQLVTQDASLGVVEGSIEIEGDRIAALGPSLPPAAPGVRCLDRQGWIALPGLIQGHIHLCQTLLRGTAEGLPLHRWLKEIVWPGEAAHDEASLRASARLGIAETLLHGATTLVDMGTVRHTEVIAKAIEELGVRALVGKALMDTGADVPPALLEDGTAALDESLALHDRWHGAARDRIRVALAPRFTLSVSQPLWEAIAREARSRRIIVHTHISETPWENHSCQEMHGATPLRALERWGILACETLLVHAIWIDEAERAILSASDAGLIHCPGSNAKLGSGVADVATWLEAGLAVGLGSDGAACNDALSVPADMRLAAQLQSLRHGPERVPPERWLEMATILGARAIGWADQIGSLSVGKQADLILYGPEDLSWGPDLPLGHRLTFGTPGPRPREVYVQGQPVVQDGELVTADASEIRREASAQRRRLLERSRIRRPGH